MSGLALIPGRNAVLALISLSAFMAVWFVIPASGLVSEQFLPGPGAVFSRALHLITEPFAGATLPGHLLSSLGRFLGGFLLAALIGVPLGLMMGWFPTVDAIAAPLLDALRFIAPIAWVPFAALWFGTGIGGPIMIIFAGAFPPCVINAWQGAKRVDIRLIEAARMLGTSHFGMITRVIMPASIPSIIAGLRISAGLGWQSLVGAELIVASTGVGFMMVQAQANIATPTVVAGMVSIGIIGLIIDILLRRLERAVTQGK
ncbi:ABC transporter permease [Pseudogemmobacter faecipullorum]|uniref:ABC transporter permease n=1 Tax=Pseudogemmobacter faecipullorum TaxID=2755041 RepID=A0ABS8CM16_9RHOB|nr:ABC transporter permease [Pseudogemmobacter faecipullorum]MCB5410421.1 ABC transporter permease [Pseudogemmobacter faecipullorum]